MKLLGNISVDCRATYQLLIRYPAFVRYWRKVSVNGIFFIDFKKACDTIRREVLNNFLSEFDISVRLVQLITVC
jgi:hypothetical protein